MYFFTGSFPPIRYTAKYFACGWWTTIAEVVCSGTISMDSVRVTPTAPGASSSTTTPGRVRKGTRRSGHMGSDRVTTQALKIVMVDAERNLLGVHGAVPGGKGGLVLIKEARKQ